ncbi:MAG: Gfo/Idh/MocA family oxidoreductase [Terriglobia bacterium]|jgi:predicted dehydrogenase
MAIRVAMIGYGAVGSVHAAKLRKEPDVHLVSVHGPKREKASAFALKHGIQGASGTIVEAVSGADAAIICSPSMNHFEQARECLEHGVHTLVEMPPCENTAEAEELACLARRRGVKLGCAHTSRFVAPFARVKKSMESGVLGRIQEINYARYHKLRERSWTDNALLHHSAHPIDLLFYWCGGVEPRGCVALPDVRLPQTVSLLGRLPAGGAATITVTYASRIHHIRMMIVGENHTIETDGFSYANSDLPELEFRGDEQETYEEAIHLQDVDFLRACQGIGNFISWDETVKVLQTIDGFRALGA